MAQVDSLVTPPMARKVAYAVGCAIGVASIAGALNGPGALASGGNRRSANGDLIERVDAYGLQPSLHQAAYGDPDLERGFPVKALHLPGSYHAGPAIHTLVGNIDSDPELEILVTGLATGPLYAWNHDGSPVAGWPITGLEGVGYMVLGQFERRSPALEVFSGHFANSSMLAMWRGNGRALHSWPRRSANYVSTPGMAVDVDGNGTDEAFICEEDWRLHGYRSNHWPLQGWPVYWSGPGGQECHTPAAADLDGDKGVEIVTMTGLTSGGGGQLLAFHADGTPMAGFPLLIPLPEVDSFPVIGDVDGDGAQEIVLLTGNPTSPLMGSFVRVVSADGVLERSIATPDSDYGSAPALADLDGDGFPEIVLQTEQDLHVWKGDGSYLPGWPRNIGPSTLMGNSAPVVGDVTGDGLPDIALTVQDGSLTGRVLLFDRDGNLHPQFPKVLPIAYGGVPAIADIDLDGRNEIVISGNSYEGYPGYTDRVWVYDLGSGPHGAILWGQFMGGPKHQGRYPVQE